ncbi:EamA family transporter [Endozoicomonas atrinae]
MVPEFWLITLYLVLFCTIFAFFAQNYGVRQTSPSRVALLMGTEPAFGAAFAMLWLGEHLTGLQILGGLLIVVCATYSSIHRASQ